MNRDQIAAALRSRPGIAQWQITEVRSRRCERYLTFLVLESERSVATCEWRVWLALPAADGRQGEAQFTITPADGACELREKLAFAESAAASAPSPAFALPEPGGPGVAEPLPTGVHAAPGSSGAAAARPQAAGGCFADDGVVRDAPTALARLESQFASAVQAAPWVRPSALELFATISDRRLLNHHGLDLSERRTRLYAEFVLLHRPAGGEETEFYDRAEAARSEGLDLAARVAESAACLRDGAAATQPPTGILPVVIGGDDLAGMLGWYAAHADAALHARKVAALVLEQPVLVRRGGDLLHVASDACVPSLAAYRFDENGWAACRQELVVADRLAGLHGQGRWMQVLGRPPRGQLGTVVVPPGTADDRALLSGALEILRFSEFRPRHDTGAFSGEIRFGWWHAPDGSRRPVRGGSVSGRLAEALADVRFSTGLATSGGYHGPRRARIMATVAA